MLDAEEEEIRKLKDNRIVLIENIKIRTWKKKEKCIPSHEISKHGKIANISKTGVSQKR